MPFTFAHPAAVLPLRKFCDPAALVIGSMIPDLGYLLMVDVPREWSHGVPGLFWFCLPLGLLAYVLYVAVLRAPWLSLAPSGIARRLAPQRSLPASARRWAVVVVSVVAGATTHLLWDGLTDLHWILERRLPLNQGQGWIIGSVSVHWYQILRHGSAVIGVAVLMSWALFAYRSTPQSPPQRGVSGETSRLRVLLGVTVLALVCALAFASAHLEEGVYATRSFSGRAARIGVGVTTLTLLAYAAAWHLRKRLRR